MFGLLGLIGFGTGAGMGLQRLIILHSWRETEARVVASSVETIGSQYRARIVVSFDVAGRTVESVPAHDYRGSKHGWIAEAVDRYPVGTMTVVHRAPWEPAKTRLGAGWNLRTFGFPLILVAVGLVFGGVGLLADRSARLESAAQTPRHTRESRALDRAQFLGMAGFIGCIALGMLVAAGVLARPAWEKRQWPVAAARVDRSDIFVRSSVNVGRHNATITTHVGRLFIRYEIGGRSYESVAVAGSSSDREKITRLLATLPPGTPWPVRVDPHDPHETAPVGGWPMVLPVVFLAVGLVLAAIAILLVRSAPSALRK